MTTQKAQVIVFIIVWGRAYALTCNPIAGLDRPRGFQEVEAPRFHDIRHMQMVSLSVLRTGRIDIPGNISGTYFS
jgi:hypothetical protein